MCEEDNYMQIVNRLCLCVYFSVHACVFTVCVAPHVEVCLPLRLPGSSVCRDIFAKLHTPPLSPHMAPNGSPTSSSGYLKSIFLNCTWHFVCAE